MSPTAQAASAERPAPCLARQPILTKDEKVMGYEVLFRETFDNPPSTSNPDPATWSIVDTVKKVGLEVVCDSLLAFIDCTDQMLLQDALVALPPDKVVAEIQPGTTVSAPLIEACQRLRKRGYKIAIDDFRKGDDREQLVPFADFLKVDWGHRAAGDYSQIVAVRAGKPYKLLAQNVDSRTEYKNAEKAGFTLFQGYFFRHPENMRVRQIPAGQTSKLRLLQAVSQSEIDFPLVEELIRHDASLCYRLMRYLNSPLLGLAIPVQSVGQAISLLGEHSLTRWIRTATALSLGQPKCSDLVLASLVRARFCELIAPNVDHGSADLFLLGMFSLMDVILETPLGILMEGLAFDTSAKAALMAMKSGGGARLSPICDLMVAREKGDWERVTRHAANLGLPLQSVNRAYIEAMEWAYQMTRIVN
jgi:EAL and modified HD-GYP domain-containing signal transduction protein